MKFLEEDEKTNALNGRQCNKSMMDRLMALTF